MIDTLIVLAKEPLAGRVKTRLTPALSCDEAALIAAACLRDTLATVSRTPARHRLLAFDGDATGWAPDGWDVVQQPEGGLDERLAAAFDAAGLYNESGSALLVGMDTPQLEAGQLLAFDPVRHEAAIGAAPDGGYWAIGFRDARVGRAAIVGVPMSASTTCAYQRERLAALGLAVHELDELTDVDTVDDLLAVAARAPVGRFRHAVGALRPRLAERAG